MYPSIALALAIRSLVAKPCIPFVEETAPSIRGFPSFFSRAREVFSITDVRILPLPWDEMKYWRKIIFLMEMSAWSLKGFRDA